VPPRHRHDLAQPPRRSHDRTGLLVLPDTYAAVGTTFATAESYEWNHGLGEIVSAVLDAGMRFTALTEYDTAPARSFYGMEKVSDEEYRLIDRPWRLPLTYTLEARRDQ